MAQPIAPQPGALNVYSYRNARTRDVQLVRLFRGEEVHAYLLVVPPGATIERHIHENKHEIFDVLEGEGVFEVEGRQIAGAAGKCVFVPAGCAHSLRNESDALWTVRVTCHDRVYPRHLGKLLARAVQKRFARWFGA